MSRHLPSAILALGACLAGPAGAQTGPGTPVEAGTSFRIESRVLGETRVVDIALPTRYTATSDRRYPVLVVLDGESQFPVATALTRFYSSVGQLPEIIVVGVRNTARTRDLSPAPVAGFDTPPGLGNTFGGADRFLTFLAEELLPHVDREYRTVRMRTLVGHSIGGTFALYALAQRPDLFTGYVVMEPATWWNNQRELEEAKAALQRPAGRRARVVMVNGPPLGLDTTRWGGAAPMIRDFDASGETHVSMPVAGLMRGLRALFADFLPSPWRPGTRPIAMLDRLDSLTDRLGYAVPIPEQTYALVARMSLDGRFFNDAEVVLSRWEGALGTSAESREYRERLRLERGTPVPAGFIPLEIPARRPTSREAAAFLGRWELIGRLESGGTHALEFRASGDTVIAHSRAQFPGMLDEADWLVIQVTADGTLELGSPWMRGVPALMVFRCRVGADGVMTATRESRGFAPRVGPADFGGTLRYRRVPGDS
jgi:predicted alpha/beta superfamily hydrolase